MKAESLLSGGTARARAARWAVFVFIAAFAIALFGAGTAQAAIGINIDQCSNGTTIPATTCSWVNGDLNKNNSLYREGDSVPFRVDVTGLDGNVATDHVLIIEYDTIQGVGKHAYDYETTYNRTVTGADPTLGYGPFSGPSTFAIPTATCVTLPGGKTPVAGNLTIWNGTITSAGSLSCLTIVHWSSPVSSMMRSA